MSGKDEETENISFSTQPITKSVFMKGDWPRCAGKSIILL